MNTKALSIVIIIALSLINSLSISAQNPKGIYREYERNEKGQPVEVVTYRGENDEHLQRMKKTTYVYEGENVIEKITYTWDSFKNQWEQSAKIAYEYTPDSLLLSTTRQVWDGSCADWSKSKEYMQYLGYNAANLLAAKR